MLHDSNLLVPTILRKYNTWFRVTFFFFFLPELFSFHDPRDNSGNYQRGIEQMLYKNRKNLLLVLNFRLVLAIFRNRNDT